MGFFPMGKTKRIKVSAENFVIAYSYKSIKSVLIFSKSLFRPETLNSLSKCVIETRLDIYLSFNSGPGRQVTIVDTIKQNITEGNNK